MAKISRKIIVLLIIIFFFTLTTISPASSTNEIKSYDNNDNVISDKLFDQKIKFWMKKAFIPSVSACIIKNNSLKWTKSYGYSDIYQRKEASTDIIYMIGSITKTVTATAIMQLYEKELFNLTDNASLYLPFDLKNPRYPNINITIKMLLSHRSSIGELEYINITPICVTKLQLENIKFFLGCIGPEEPYPWIEEELTDPYLWSKEPPGVHEEYSNKNFIILGMILERLSGQTLEEYCQEKIFEPLNMNNTSFYVSNLNLDKLAVPYIHFPIRFRGMYVPLPQYETRAYKAAGGLRTTLDDFSHFFIAHMNGGVYNNVRILNESTVEMMHNRSYPDGNYGLGWMYRGFPIIGLWDGHGGGTFGFMSLMMVKRPENIGILYFYNEWYPPLFSVQSVPLKEAIFTYVLINSLLEKAEKL